MQMVVSQNPDYNFHSSLKPHSKERAAETSAHIKDSFHGNCIQVVQIAFLTDKTCSCSPTFCALNAVETKINSYTDVDGSN